MDTAGNLPVLFWGLFGFFFCFTFLIQYTMKNGKSRAEDNKDRSENGEENRERKDDGQKWN